MLQMTQLDLFWHFTWKIRGSNSSILGTNKKLREDFSQRFQKSWAFILTGQSPKSLSCTPDMETIYQWRNSTHGTFPSLISLHGACHFFFVLLQSLESRMCADFPRKDKQSVATRLWITKLNKYFYERRRISACETSVLECSVCFHSIVFFQCQSLSVSWINSYACTVLLTHIHAHIYTQTSTHPHTHTH